MPSKATRIAGELAGLKVEKLINEPRPPPSPMVYTTRKRLSWCSTWVAGPFDVSVLELFEGMMEVRASDGDNFLGGEDFDDALVTHHIGTTVET